MSVWGNVWGEVWGEVWGGIDTWTEPTCTITTGITMTANVIDDDITMTETEITTNIGMGCGYQ